MVPAWSECVGRCLSHLFPLPISRTSPTGKPRQRVPRLQTRDIGFERGMGLIFLLYRESSYWLKAISPKRRLERQTGTFLGLS